MESIKYNNIFSIFKLLTSIFILASVLALSTISVSADEPDPSASAGGAFSNNDGRSNGAVTSGARIKNSMDRANYGYLVYLVKNPSGTNTAEPLPGLKPVLFMCNSTLYEDASHWPNGASVETEPLNWDYCRDRMGFYDPIDPTTRMYTVNRVWNVTPYHSDGDTKISNTQQITDWLATSVNGKTQAEKFIDTYWPDTNYAQEFRDDNIVIVIETVANFGLFQGRSIATSAREAAIAEMQEKYGKLDSACYSKLIDVCKAIYYNESLQYHYMDKEFMQIYSLINCYCGRQPYSYIKELTGTYLEAVNNSEPSPSIAGKEMAIKLYYIKMYNAYLTQYITYYQDNATENTNGYESTHNYPFVATLARIHDYMVEIERTTGKPAASPANTIPTRVLPWTQQLRFPQIGYPKNSVQLNGQVGQQVGWADMKNSGTSMLMYKASTMTIAGVQSTCDENKIPTEHGAPDESTGNCVIIKTYREKVNGVITADKGTYYRYNVCPNIIIDDEGFGDNCYKVVAWRETDRLKRTGINAFNWEGTVPGRIGQSGDSSGSVVLDNSNGYKYLYVLLERGSTDTKSNYNITEAEIARGIRLTKPDIFDADDNTLVDITPFQFRWRRGSIGTRTHTHHHNDGNCKREAFSCSNRDDHKHHPDGNNDCDGHSHTTTGDNACPEGCTSKHECENGCKHTCNNNCYDCYKCKGHKCSNYTWSDSKITLRLVNNLKYNYKNILATKSGWDAIITSVTSNTLWTSSPEFPSASYSSGHNTDIYSSMDMIGVIHRGKDKLTIAKWKNEAANTTAIADLQDISTVGSAVAGYRVDNKPLNESSNSRETIPYNDKFYVQIGNASSADELTVKIKAQTQAEPLGAGEGCEHSTQYILSIPSSAPNRQAKATVYVKVYSGDANGGLVDESFDNSEMITAGSSGNIVKSGRMIKLDDSTVTTYPYIQMHYYNRNGVAADGSRIAGERKTAYVLGEYKRSFMLNAYAEIQWKKTDSANVTLESLQWSTHAEVEKDGFSFGEVLPGGATLNLTIPEANRQEVIIKTYNPILAGAGKAQVEATGGSIPDALDFEKAKEAHGKFVLSAIDGLSSLTFRQWYLPEKITKWEDAKVGNLWDDSVGGYEIWANMTNPTPTSKDKKYYFTPITSATDGKLATEGDLDADVYNYSNNTSVGIKGQTDKINAIYDNSNVTYATFWVDPKGSIRIAAGSNLDTVSNTPKSNPYAGTEIAYRVGDTTAWVSDSSGIISTAREIDEKTYIIRKLTLAFEKGGGNDNTAATAGADAAWYNEAFDGVTYAIVETKVMVGFADPGERSTVLDPVLCPAIDNGKGQTGMFSKYNTSQFKLMNKTNGYTEEYKIGQYRGQDIKMNEFDYLFYSDKFWIPNVTVQDLK